MHNNINVSFNNFIKINEKHKRILINLLIKCSKPGLHFVSFFIHIVYTRFKHYFFSTLHLIVTKNIQKKKGNTQNIYKMENIQSICTPISDREYRLSRIYIIRHKEQFAQRTSSNFLSKKETRSISFFIVFYNRQKYIKVI